MLAVLKFLASPKVNILTRQISLSLSITSFELVMILPIFSFTTDNTFYGLFSISIIRMTTPWTGSRNIVIWIVTYVDRFSFLPWAYVTKKTLPLLFSPIAIETIWTLLFGNVITTWIFRFRLPAFPCQFLDDVTLSSRITAYLFAACLKKNSVLSRIKKTSKWLIGLEITLWQSIKFTRNLLSTGIEFSIQRMSFLLGFSGIKPLPSAPRTIASTAT